MASFDIVSEVDMQEVDNAVNQVAREIQTRFDFKGGKSEISFDREAKTLKLIADDDMKLRSLHQILETKMSKRGIDLRSLEYGPEEEAGGTLIRQTVTLKLGISKEIAKKINKMIKDAKLKVQSQTQDEQVRVTGKKLDDLQAVIQMLKTEEVGLPLQFVNMRS